MCTYTCDWGGAECDDVVAMDMLSFSTRINNTIADLLSVVIEQNQYKHRRGTCTC